MTSKGKTWSLGTNSRFPFAINVTLNLSIDKNTKKLAHENSHLSLLQGKRCFTGVTSAPQQQKFPSGEEQGVMAVFAGYEKKSISWTWPMTHFVLVGTVQAIPSRQASSISSFSTSGTFLFEHGIVKS